MEVHTDLFHMHVVGENQAVFCSSSITGIYITGIYITDHVIYHVVYTVFEMNFPGHSKKKDTMHA